MDAPRRLSRFMPRCVRGVRRLWLSWLVLMALGAVAQADESVCVPGDGAYLASICLVDAPGPDRYGHGVLGDTPEWDELHVIWGPQASGLREKTSKLREADHVYEDIAPRVVDLDGDEIPEIVVVQSGFFEGARLVVYRVKDGLSQVATPYIGTRFRWLAPVGTADLDGDGYIEIGYVDRPHLAKTLQVWRYRDGSLEFVDRFSGVTNHRIGEPFITGGIRDCGDGPEVVLADAGWRQILAVRLAESELSARALGAFRPETVAAALRCD